MHRFWRIHPASKYIHRDLIRNYIAHCNFGHRVVVYDRSKSGPPEHDLPPRVHDLLYRSYRPVVNVIDADPDPPLQSAVMNDVQVNSTTHCVVASRSSLPEHDDKTQQQSRPVGDGDSCDSCSKNTGSSVTVKRDDLSESMMIGKQRVFFRHLCGASGGGGEQDASSSRGRSASSENAKSVPRDGFKKARRCTDKLMTVVHDS